MNRLIHHFGTLPSTLWGRGERKRKRGGGGGGGGGRGGGGGGGGGAASLNILLYLRTEQEEHVNPLMFSTSPITLNFIFLQKLISFLMVANAIFWGVVTMIAPSGRALIRVLMTVRCSSEVPGGVSLGGVNDIIMHH